MSGRSRRRALAAALGVVVILATFGPLLSPRVALGDRDVPRFHLPLRTAFVHLAGHGAFPVWNPGLHGGQPILSNPNYAAFYPPTWLAVLVGPVYGLNLLVLLHAALAFAGAWFLARRLGCGPPAAALAAVGFVGGGAFVSLTASLNLLCGLAWLPWVLAAADRLIRNPPGPEGDPWLPAACGGGAALAATLLAGDPTATLVAGLGALAVAVQLLRRSLRGRGWVRLARLGALFAVAVALGAVQWIPTWQRIADTPRAGPLPLATATEWSTPPLRAAEVVFPRLWGDPARADEGLFLGWNLHDRSYPYVVSIYPGLLVTLLGFSTLLLGPSSRRGVWLTALGLGVFLALGRHNPLYPWLHEHVPILGRTRYPEKFLLLSTGVLPFVAALGWQRLLAERRRGRTEGVDLALGLAVVFLTISLALTWWVHSRPDAVDPLIRAGSPLPPSERSLATGRSHLQREAWTAVAATGTALLVLALYRWRRVPGALVVVLPVALLAVDLWHYGHRLVHTVPAELYRRPPPLAAEIRQGDGPSPRIYRLPDAQGEGPTLVFDRGTPSEPSLRHAELALERLEPLTGMLWGLGYAFPPDYDLMLTGRAVRNRRILDASWETPDAALRVLGAWSVASLVAVRSDQERLEAALEERPLSPAHALTNPYHVPTFRFVPRIVVHPDEASALAGVREGDYDLAHVGHWVGPGELGPRPVSAKPELLAAEDRGDQVEIRYRAAGDSYLVAAVTWDRGWSARVDGAPRPLFLTAIGQIGCVVPPGEHRLRLVYRDPWVSVGTAVSLGSATVLALLVLVARGRSRGAGERPERRIPPASAVSTSEVSTSDAATSDASTSGRPRS